MFKLKPYAILKISCLLLYYLIVLVSFFLSPKPLLCDAEYMYDNYMGIIFLQALSMLLNATPYSFVVDLACLASRREYLNMDKWLSDKIQEHKEPFISACVSFLKRRCPQLMGPGAKDELPQSKSQQLPPDTIGHMVTCLKQYAGWVFMHRFYIL